MIILNRRQTVTLMGSALAMPYIKRAHAQESVLNVYNWADYIGETTIEDFEKATGIKVNYDNYASTEEMQAKVFAGMTGYDLIVIAGLDMPRYQAAGLFQKLDRSKLPSWGNLDPEILRLFEAWDPGVEHGMPYMWGSVGVTFNVDMVKERIPDADFESLDLIFKPELAEKLADCGISILDSPQDVIPMVLNYLGRDGKAANPSDYGAVVEAFDKIRPLIRTFDNNNYLNTLPNGEVCVVNNWSGDYATAKWRAEEAGVDINLAYYVPKTGAPAWAECFSIPSDAQHVENAHKFLEYMLQPEVIAACTNYVNYANANAASKPFIDPAILADPAVYPDEATIKRMWAPAPWTDEQNRALTRTWTEIRSG